MLVTTSAPAKVILLGEHSVVYGQPALAVPVSSLRAYAELTTLSFGAGLQITIKNIDSKNTILMYESHDFDNPLVLASRLFLERFSSAPPDVNISLRSEIPIASGLGSGAAIVAALLRALAIATRAPLTTEILNEFVYESEKKFHGTPSGIDNTVIVFERPVYFVRGQPIQRLRINEPFVLLIGDTGISASTKSAVSDVRRLYESDTVYFESLFESIGNLVDAGRIAIEDGNRKWLGEIMNRNHEILQELSVSSPELDVLVCAAREAGALGAKLSGGGHGGNMIALVEEDTVLDVETALLEAGAVRLYKTVVNEV